MTNISANFSRGPNRARRCGNKSILESVFEDKTMQSKSILGPQTLRAIRVKTWVEKITTGETASTFFNIFQGRCTFAAIIFSATGVYGWLHGRDLTSYALFVTAVQGLLVLHSWKEDVAEQREIRQTQESGTPQ
jgi:hypothetical protein